MIRSMIQPSCKIGPGRVSFDDPMDAQLERPCCVKNQQLKASNSNSENNAAITCCTSIQLSKGQFIASKSEEEWSQNLEIETIHAAHGSRPLELPHPNHGLLRGSLRANAPPPPPKTALQLRAELCIRNT